MNGDEVQIMDEKKRETHATSQAWNERSTWSSSVPLTHVQ